MFGVQAQSLKIAKIAIGREKIDRLNLSVARENASKKIEQLVEAARFNKGKANVKRFKRFCVSEVLRAKSDKIKQEI